MLQCLANSCLCLGPWFCSFDFRKISGKHFWLHVACKNFPTNHLSFLYLGIRIEACTMHKQIVWSMWFIFYMLNPFLKLMRNFPHASPIDLIRIRTWEEDVHSVDFERFVHWRRWRSWERCNILDRCEIWERLDET